MDSPVDVTKLAEILLSGSLAFSGLAIGGIALAVSAYLVVRGTREVYPAKLLMALLLILSLALVTAVVAAAFSFAFVVWPHIGPNFPGLMTWSTSFMGITLLLLLVGAAILTACFIYLK